MDQQDPNWPPFQQKKNLDKSYESMRSDEKDPLHYNIDSDNEPPQDEPGDKLTIVKKGQVIKEILEVGEGLGKPGRPYICTVTYVGRFADKTEFVRQDEPVQMTLGDETVLYGLWKAIEHMRRGEKSQVMIKPKWGFRHPDYQDRVKIPEGWESDEKIQILKKRRVFYEVKLYDWIVRHDLDGDKMLMKTILSRGVGYDRPFDYDEITIDLKVYQKNEDGSDTVYQEFKDLSTVIHERKHVSNTLKKIMQSMKTEERVQCVVHPEYFKAKDEAYINEYGIKTDRYLLFDIDMKKLIRVDDLYKDRTTFYKTLIKGEGTASPYTDGHVLLKVKIVVDGVVKFCHQNFENLDLFTDRADAQPYDMEEYKIPSVIMKILKTTKRKEVVEVITKRADKLVPHFEDESGIFVKENLTGFKDEVIITFALVEFEDKDHLFKSTIEEKVERFTYLKNLANKFYKAGNMKKAEKIYTQINMYFRSKDAKNNFQKEDEQTTMFRDAKLELENINKFNLTNLCIMNLKKKQWADVIKFADDALLVDHRHSKARFLKGKALMELTEYEKAIESFQDLVDLDPEHEEGQKELAKAQLTLKKYKEKETKMFKKMFE